MIASQVYNIGVQCLSQEHLSIDFSMRRAGLMALLF